MSENIIPTITLAELFEAQYQLVDAVNIYAQLKQISSSKEIEDKIRELTDIIFESINRDYADKISMLFSKEELRYFRIIPGQTVQVNSRETLLDEARLDIETDREEDISEKGLPENIIEHRVSHDEISISSSELEEIEKRLEDKPEIQLENLITDKDSLKKEKEELLKKLETIEQKLKRLAEEKG